MAQPVFYQTLNMQGVDPTVYYAVSASATPEYPAPPFQQGTQAFGSDGSQFVFVQASTSISLTDFVVLNSGSTTSANGAMANSVTSTTVTSSLAVGLGSAGIVVAGSVSYIPAGAYFWACTRGQNIPATTSAGLATNASGVALFTSTTAGVLTSVTTSQSLAAAFAGIICVNSLTTTISSSIIPGGVQGPVVNMNNVRPVVTTANSATLIAGANLQIWSF
jgi:hypothetical protein